MVKQIDTQTIKRGAFALLFGTAIGLFAPLASAGPLEDVSGLWLTESKTGHVQIDDCGDGTPCGTLVWVESDQDTDNPLDINNKKPELRTRPLIGSQMLYGFKRKKEVWKKGKIYNAADGKTYGSALERLDANTLEVKGCLGPICKTQYWNRLPVEAIKP